jgi:hypothetical protein
MIKNYANTNSLIVGDNWKKLKEEFRIEMINDYLKNNTLYKDLQVVKALDDGQVILKVNNNILANKRADMLLDLEELLKIAFDAGINLWCEVVSDKSKLRQLRGVKIKI